MKRRASVPAFAIATLLATAGMQAQAAVKAPPLPAGSEVAQVQGGMNPEEMKREKRAHHHKGHVKKDFTKDDSGPGKAKDGENGKSTGNNKSGG